MSNFAERLEEAMNLRHLKQSDLCRLTGMDKSLISNYLKGAYKAKQNNLYLLAKVLNVSEAWLMGYNVPMERNFENSKLQTPEISEDNVLLDVIGEIAAGYDFEAQEDWSGEKIEVPRAYLKGAPKSDFFVLSVHGDSMYPQYMNGDLVVIRKTPTLDYSGQVGAILYDGGCATLKRVEYAYGQDWIRMVPINPDFPPKTIRGVDLEQCRIIGVPVLLIREIRK